MLVRLHITNFLSFKEEAEFCMIADPSLKQHDNHKINVGANRVDLLKSSIIYGANGAGKSNLVQALLFFKHIVNNGKVSKEVSTQKYRFGGTEDPMTLEVEIAIAQSFYTYGIQFTDNLVVGEWLYLTSNIKRPIKIYNRTYDEAKNQPTIDFDANYLFENTSDKESDKYALLISLMEENLLLNNELLLTKNQNFKSSHLENVLNWFMDSLTIISPNSKAVTVAKLFEEYPHIKLKSEELIRSLNTGIDTFSIVRKDLDEYVLNSEFADPEILTNLKEDLDRDSGNNTIAMKFKDKLILIDREDNRYVIKEIVTNRTIGGKNYQFNLSDESDGTQRIIDLIPMIDSVISYPKVFVVDEMDRSLHPNLIYNFIKKVMSETTQGQLIFTTHESSLLNCDLFRTDEIWFVEKNSENQSTEIYSLNEFKPRLDMNLEKGYLNGRFGAIPFLSNLKDLNWS